MKKRTMKKVVSFALAIMMVLTSVLIGGVETKADETVYTLELSADKTSIETNGIATITAVVKENGTEVTNLTEAGLDLWFWTDTTGATVTSDTTGKSLTATVTSTQAGDIVVKADLKIGGTWYAYDDVTVTVAGASSSTPVYELSITADKETAEVGETVTITGVVKKDGTEVTNLTEAGLDLWFWTDTTGATVTSDTTGKSLTATVTSTQAGDIVVKADLKIGGTWYAYDDVTVAFTGASIETPVYEFVSLTADKESVEAGGTIKLTAVVTKDGQPVTDLEAEGLHIWWSHDWDSGNQDADYDDENSRSLTCDVKIPSAGEYYFKAKLEHQAGDTWTPLGEKYITLTGEAATTTPPPADEPKDEPKEEEKPVVNVELKNTGFESAIGETWYGNAVDGTWEDTTQFDKVNYSSSKVNGIIKPDDNAGNSLLWFSLAAGDQIDIVQWVAELPAGTYTIKAPAMGNNVKVQIILGTSEDPKVKGNVQLNEWNVWETAKATFVVKEDMYNVQIGFRLTATEPESGDADTYSWGYIDNVSLKQIPKTGDTSNIYAYVMLMMAGCAIVGYSVKRRKEQF